MGEVIDLTKTHEAYMDADHRIRYRRRRRPHAEPLRRYHERLVEWLVTGFLLLFAVVVLWTIGPSPDALAFLGVFLGVLFIASVVAIVARGLRDAWSDPTSRAATGSPPWPAAARGAGADVDRFPANVGGRHSDLGQ